MFEWGKRTYIMGILNITPDSFSGDGLLARADPLKAVLDQARVFAKAGVDILDVGGESTRPGAQPVSAAEEEERVIPVIRALAAELDLPISIDTYKASVASAAFQAGAKILNDVWGLRADPALASTAARHKAQVILMHNRSSWASAEIKERLGGRYIGVNYENLMEDIKTELLESVGLAHAAGIPDEHIILDPGVGFGKTVEQNLEIINCLEQVKKLGYPVLLGPSRKSFIGFTLDAVPENRLEGTAAAVVVGIVRGADLVRVHDVEFMAPLVRMTDALVRRPRS